MALVNIMHDSANVALFLSCVSLFTSTMMVIQLSMSNCYGSSNCDCNYEKIDTLENRLGAVEKNLQLLLDKERTVVISKQGIHTQFFYYSNPFYKNHEAQISEILRIF